MLHYHSGWAAARQLVEAVTWALAQEPGLVEFNATQMALSENHAGSLTFPVLNGFPYLIMADVNQLTLITEYPDETLSEPHNAQMATVVGAGSLRRLPKARVTGRGIEGMVT